MCTIKILIATVLLSPCALYSQAWSGILSAVGSGGCSTLAPSSAPSPCGIDWTQNGVNGGIPSSSWTQLGSTITATGSDQTSQIQTALNGCGGSGHTSSTTGQYVLLAAGTFTINTELTMPSYCALRGSGANNTILSTHGGSAAPIIIGVNQSPTNPPGGIPLSSYTSINAGATAGSTSITLGSVSGVSTGTYLVISESNNTNWVNPLGSEGLCTYCDAGWSTTGAYVRGQIVEVEGVAGNVVTISPGLYTAYNQSPFAVPFSAASKYAGLEDLQVYANNTGYGDAILLNRCADCWVKGVETNYTDGNMLEDSWGYRNTVMNSYFSNAFQHGEGTDADIDIDFKTSAGLYINNIIERGHNAVMLNEGAAGNVVAYNYTEGGYDAGGTNWTYDGILMHGSHPQFNLIEGNVTVKYNPDNIHGSSSHNTTFRNWFEGNVRVCSPIGTTRATVTCGTVSDSFQVAYAEGINQLSWYANSIGDVTGSTRQQNVLAYGSGAMTPEAVNDFQAGQTNPTLTFDRDAVDLLYGYDAHADNGTTTFCSGNGLTVPCQSVVPEATNTVYKTYTFASTSTQCLSGGSSSTCSASLPSSFFLSGSPTWWNTANVPYPAIGPDVTGGTGPGGHASLTASNPAQYCYLVTMGGSEGGANSPLTFNENTCYASSSGGGSALTSGTTTMPQVSVQ